MAQITLAYDVSVGLQDPASLLARIAAIDIDQEYVFLQMTKISDNTVAGVRKVTRTIVLETTPEADAMFPTAAELVAATRGLCSGVLGLGTPGAVTAATPVVS